MKLGGEIKTRRGKHESGRRPIDSRGATRSPATLAGLTVYLGRCPAAMFSYGMRRFRRAVLE